MHSDCELGRENLSHEREVEISDQEFEELNETDDLSVYSTPVLSPASSVASFKSCFSAFEDFEAVADSLSREEDDDIIPSKHTEIEIEELVINSGNELALDSAPRNSTKGKPKEILDEKKNAEHVNGQLTLEKIEINPPYQEIADEENEMGEELKQDQDEANGQFRFLVKNFLEVEGIPFAVEESGDNWLDVVSSLSWKALKLLDLSVNGWNPMDPRLYVKIKCIASGSPHQSQLIKGLVFKKNTTHRHMASSLQNPRLMLFQGNLGQNTAGLFSFDSMEQEMNQLKSTIRLIDTCRPEVVLVEKTVSRDIQESLLKKGITLVYDMKLHRLKRISLCTGSPIIASIDTPIRTELKQCNHFHVEKFFEELMGDGKVLKRQSKTLMFFEGCPKPLGCTILLKGDQIENLKRVKRAVKLAVYAAHHLILERSFIEAQRKIFKDDPIITDFNPSGKSEGFLNLEVDCPSRDIHISKEDAIQTCSCKESAREVSCFEKCHSLAGVNGSIQASKNGSSCNFLDNQSILMRQSLQFSSKGIICEPSRLSRIFYYRRCDKPLGKFLRGVLLEKGNLCSSCNEALQAHSYSYTHYNGNLSIMVKRISPGKHLPGQEEGKIWMWAQHVSHGSQKLTGRVLLSDSAQGLSFGKFLELSFSSRSSFGTIYQHGRLPYKDWILFFGAGSYAAMFVYSPIDIYTASQPPQVFNLGIKTEEHFLEREARDLLQEAEQLFSDVESLLMKIKSGATGKHHPLMETNQVERMWREEKLAFEDCLTKIIKNEVTSGDRIHSAPFLNQVLLLDQYIWDCRINSLCSTEIEEVNDPHHLDETYSKEMCEMNREVPVSGISILVNDGRWLEKSNPSHFFIWKPFSEILQSYKGCLGAESSQKFDFLQSYTPLHLPKRQRLVNAYKNWVHFSLGEDLGIISVSEDEISSIISCALKKKKSRLNTSVSCPSFLSDELVSPNSVSIDHQETRVLIGKESNKSGITVISLFAEQFQKLRGLLCIAEMSYVASMSRCKTWSAQGGKSKAIFAKSLDGKLVIKQINRTEFDSFLQFGPEYFKYIYSSLSSGSQTCLAKILGMYQVKQMKNGKETKIDVVVMENLLYGRSVSRVYDLKGAVFSRFVHADDDDPGKVLLDQNFMHDMGAHPFYVTLPTKRLLQRAIWNDTAFLTSMGVMDYSLLMGVDEKRREVVFGIIDYLRQYTWDKKLETWAKASWVVPKNELPTVISPREYRKRFRNFMSRNFLIIPDASS